MPDMGMSTATSLTLGCPHIMHRKIDISEVKVGMKLAIKKSWFQTDLFYHNFVVKNNLDIEKLKNHQDSIYLIANPIVVNNLKILRVILKDIESSKIIDNRKTIKAIENIATMVLSGQYLADEIIYAIKSDSMLFRKSVRILLLSLAFGKYLGFSRERIINLAVSSFLHDISLAGMAKTGCIDRDEVLYHTKNAARLLSLSNFNDIIVRTVLNHHENYDGTGYPSCLKGRSINIEARILRVLDIYVGMTSERPYRSYTYTIPEAIKHISQQAKSKKLDTVVVSKFLRFINKEP